MLEIKKSKRKDRLKTTKNKVSKLGRCLIGNIVFHTFPLDSPLGRAKEIPIIFKSGRVVYLGFEPSLSNIIKKGKFKGRPMDWYLAYIESPSFNIRID